MTNCVKTDCVIHIPFLETAVQHTAVWMANLPAQTLVAFVYVFVSAESDQVAPAVVSGKQSLSVDV